MVTSDKPVVVRLKGAFVATTIAEYLRDQGLNVMLLVDSITRLANAQRELGLAIGEPPTTRGYTPSVFSVLPKLLERTGITPEGSITAMYTVLVEGDDLNEPVSDTVRGILDGHIILSRKMAAQNHYPAIDILNSVSRCMIDIVSPGHMQAAQRLRSTYAVYKEAEDMINVGAYVEGKNHNIDFAISMYDKVTEFLRQGVDEQSNHEEDIGKLEDMINVGAYVEGKNHKIDFAISMYDKVTAFLRQGVDEQSNQEKDIGRLEEMMKDYGGKVQQKKVAVGT